MVTEEAMRLHMPGLTRHRRPDGTWKYRVREAGEDEDCLACDGEGWFYPEDDDFWNENYPA
jgi:hypothetical protein